MEIIYVTKNWAKIMSAKQILEPLGIKVNNEKMEITEIQADTVEEVAIHSAKEASEKLKTTVLKNDTVHDALAGFLGPYTHYVDERLGEDGILKLLENVDNRDACFIEAFAYCEYGKDPIVFKSVTKGKIAKKSLDHMDGPDGHDKTMGSYPDEERFLIWNTDAYYQLAEYLKNK